MNMSDDQELLVRLADALETSDPMPETVARMAKAVPALSRLDGELAVLLEQSATLAGIRSDHTHADVPLVFESPTLAVAVEFGLDTIIDVVGPAVTGVEIETAQGARIPAEPIRQPGRYRPIGSASGSMRVVVTTEDDRRVVTDWFTAG